MHRLARLSHLSTAQRLCKRHGSVATRVRTLSSGSSYESNTSQSPQGQHVDREISLLGPPDIRTPLPGNVGIPINQLKPAIAYHSPLDKTMRPVTELDMYRVDTAEDRQRKIYSKLLKVSSEVEDASSTEALLKSNSELDCTATDCPTLVKQDFQELFPLRNLLSEPLTVITVAHRTMADMSVWSEELDLERDDLVEKFTTKARFVCKQLQEAGYWADFIDPNSGKPYLNANRISDDVLFETDYRYRHLGFTIEDLGCCKVISHHKWGRNAFIGVLFTNAPKDSADVQRIMAGNGN